MRSPVIFKEQREMQSFMDGLPTPAGEAKVGEEQMNAMAMIAEMRRLVPSLFDYLKVLSKSAGGLGNNKSVKRFIEAAAGNVAEEALLEYFQEIEKIETEAQDIFNLSGSEELSNQLYGARKKVTQFKVMRNTILAFKNKLKARMDNIEEKYAQLSKIMQQQNKALVKLLESPNLAALQSEVDEKYKFTKQLSADMSRYCDLQIGYNTILLAGN